MQQSHPPLGSQLPQRGLQLQRLVQCLPHELLDQPLAPGAQRPPSEPSGKPLDPGEPDAQHFVGLAVEHVNAGVTEDLGDLALLARLVIVVAQDRDDRHRDRRRVPWP